MNNFFDCLNMCYEVLGVVLIDVVGIGKGMVLFEDFEQVDVIFVFGQNFGINYFWMLVDLCKVVVCGVCVVVFNLLKEKGLQCFVDL